VRFVLRVRVILYSLCSKKKKKKNWKIYTRSRVNKSTITSMNANNYTNKIPFLLKNGLKLFLIV